MGGREGGWEREGGRIGGGNREWREREGGSLIYYQLE